MKNFISQQRALKLQTCKDGASLDSSYYYCHGKQMMYMCICVFKHSFSHEPVLNKSELSHLGPDQPYNLYKNRTLWYRIIAQKIVRTIVQPTIIRWTPCPPCSGSTLAKKVLKVERKLALPNARYTPPPSLPPSLFLIPYLWRLPALLSISLSPQPPSPPFISSMQ